VARKTWLYFDTLAGAEDHWLPPDNFQEERQPQVAHRTSPTNIGMGLLSILAAHDLGFIGIESMVERLDHTLSTVEALERHEGHLLNWYDTQKLAPLLPHYVSTVDSGNLAGALLTLAEGCRRAGELLGASRPDLAATLASLARRADAMAEGMNFAFLYDRKRQLFTIGYRLADAGGPGAPTAPTSTCWPPSRASRASSPSPKATSRRATGSTSAGWSSACAACRRSSRGARRCSST
jgi:cyclic beta-1,2-glucan synthetase